MFARLYQRITQQLVKRNFPSDDELYLYVVSMVANWFCLAVHVFLFAIFMFAQVAFFSYYNLFSILMYFMLFILIQSGRYHLASLLLSIEVMVYTLITSYMVGIESYVLGYYLLVIVLQTILPYGTVKLRAGITIGVLVFVTASILIHYNVAVPLVLPLWLERLHMIANIYIMIAGALVELYIGNIVRRLIDGLNRARMEELTTQANTDQLTGLYNRRFADTYFQRMHNQPGTACVAMLDIDDFKVVNDTHGHPCGDEVLQQLSIFLLSTLRSSDIVFRWGGEEFLIVLSNVSIDTAYDVLDNARRKLQRIAFPTSCGDICITVTIGIAPLAWDDTDGSIERSDRKLYIGKRTGKNVVVI